MRKIFGIGTIVLLFVCSCRFYYAENDILVIRGEKGLTERKARVDGLVKELISGGLDRDIKQKFPIVSDQDLDRLEINVATVSMPNGSDQIGVIIDFRYLEPALPGKAVVRYCRERVTAVLAQKDILIISKHEAL